MAFGISSKTHQHQYQHTKNTLFRDLGSQLGKLLCDLWCCQVHLEELTGCLDDLLPKVQVLCEGTEREKEGEKS